MRKQMLLICILFLTGFGAAESFLDFDKKGKAAIIQLEGQISSSSSNSPLNSGGITPGHLRQLNSEAKSRGADTIIYEWNSGGGAVVASKEMMRIIEDVEMPTVCRFRDISASGGYLASLGCDRIVADSASITGSIGVRSSYLEFSGLLQRFGVEYVNISSGKYKETGSQYRNITKEEKDILKEKTDLIHEEFLNLVDEERNLTEKQVETISTGEIFLGSEAAKTGLVDSLGGREKAVEIARNLTEHKKLETFKVSRSSNFNFLELLLSNSWIDNFVSTDIPIKAEIG